MKANKKTCIRCKGDVGQRFKMCKKCRVTAQIKLKQERQIRIALGQCTFCSNVAVTLPNGTKYVLCHRHLLSNRINARVHYYKNRPIELQL